MVAGLLFAGPLLVALWVTLDLAFGTQKVVLGVAGFMFSASYGFWPIGAIISPLLTGYAVAAAWELDRTMLILVVPALLLSGALVIAITRR